MLRGIFCENTPFHLGAKQSPSPDVTAHASLSCRFICGGSDIKQGRTCKAWVKSRKEAPLSELKSLFPAFCPFFERCLVLRRSPADDVGLPGFEPRMTGPESVVLPLHHSPMLVCECKSRTNFHNRKEKCEKFVYLLKYFSIFT